MSYPYYSTGWRRAGKRTQAVAVSVYKNCKVPGDLRYKIDVIAGNKVRSRMVKDSCEIFEAVSGLSMKYRVPFDEDDLVQDIRDIVSDIKKQESHRE
jgi:hypothetical protein